MCPHLNDVLHQIPTKQDGEGVGQQEGATHTETFPTAGQEMAPAVQFQQPDYHLDRERSAAKFWKVGAVSGRLGVHSSTKGNTCLLKV